MKNPSAKSVLEKHRDRILALPGVEGVAFGLSPTSRKENCILVYTRSGKLPDGLEEQLEGIPVEATKSPGFKAL